MKIDHWLMHNVSVIPMCMIILIVQISGCSRTGLKTGDRLPDLVFYDLNGNKVKIYDYVEPGKRLLIHFWGAACCLTYSTPTIESVSTIHKSGNFKKVNVVSVNLDYPALKVLRIVRELKVEHTMLFDKDASYYRAEPRLRFFFPLAVILIVDEEGMIKGKLCGPQLLPSIKEVLVEDAA